MGRSRDTVKRLANKKRHRLGRGGCACDACFRQRALAGLVKRRAKEKALEELFREHPDLRRTFYGGEK